MIRFIENIGDYFSQHFFTDDFPKKVFDHVGYITEKKDESGENLPNHLSDINSKVALLSEKYYRFKNDYLNVQREKDRVRLGHSFHTAVLEVLGYVGLQDDYKSVYIDEKEFIPVRQYLTKNDKPYLYVMEMKPMIKISDGEPEGIYEQVYMESEWGEVFPSSWINSQLKSGIINESLSELFLLPKDERPEYVLMLAGPKIFLINYEKWKYDSYLLFDLEELFTESRVRGTRDYLALFYALLSRQQFLIDTDSLLNRLEEDAHKAAYGVTQTLKNGVIYAVENLANEAIYYKLNKVAKIPAEREAVTALMAEEAFAGELKEECLTLVYRLLFLFYAEAREDLAILPVRDSVYQKGYSLEMLRDLEMVALTSDSSRNGYFFSESLWKLFGFLFNGQQEKDGFIMKPLDSPLFDDAELKHLKGVHFRNYVLQEIILRLSLSERTKKKGRGRISYGNLGINQLGSVYESLLAYSGFFAAEDLIEVKAADDPTGKEGTFLVPKIRRDKFEEEEVLKDPIYTDRDVEIKKGMFVYRLNGRDRKKSASYYTPEVLTQCTVKYTLKNILNDLKERQEKREDCADEILGLKILEPAMGAAAFHNETINQLATAYLELKENEVIKRGGKRVLPGEYNDELQKVKAFIASNNVYGVDINPTAIELGKLSLWLNCMHYGMETPFFAHRLGTGNAVIGAWLKVYSEKDVLAEYPSGGTKKQRETPLKKTWWEQAPKKVRWNKNGKISRKETEIYHFLLPDENMVPSAGIRLLKDELINAEQIRFAEWKKAFYQPLATREVRRLQKLSAVIDVLFEEHYQQIAGINKDTASHYRLYAQPVQPLPFKNYHEKERLANNRNSRTAPYFKLKTIMDYWCSFWFWDIRKVAELPTRTEWYDELQSLIGVDLSSIGETPTPVQIKQAMQQQVSSQTLFIGNRLLIVDNLANRYRYFHNELEFIEVFKEKGGFDVIVGNPPWIKLLFEEKDIIAEKNPEVMIRKTAAPEVKKLQAGLFKDSKFKETYLEESIGTESTAIYLNACQNYPLLKGQQTNLYKCVIEDGFELLGVKGFMGLLHPEGVYDDPNGLLLREEIYPRLKYHFQFQNAFNLFLEVAHREKYSVNVFSGKPDNIQFWNINNLFQPSTITASFEHDGAGDCGGIKIKEKSTGDFVWNIKPHRSRVIQYTKKQLQVLATTFENSDDWKEARLVSVHAKEILLVLEKLGEFRSLVRNFKNKITVCWDETNDVNSGNIERNTKYPEIDKFEMIYSGPHFFVSNPLYKTPREISKEKADYDVIDITEIGENYVARTNYTPKAVMAGYGSIIKGFQIDKDIEGKPIYDNWLLYYKLGFRKMLSQAGERTLTSAILPPKAAHINGVISIIFQDEQYTIELHSLTSSIIYDFYIKTLGKSNLYDDTIGGFPLGILDKFKPHLFVRTLLLNCLNKYYAPLWQGHWQDRHITESWSKIDGRLKPFNTLTEEWQWSTPLRNWYERRQALVETDVITAIALDLTLEELILIYNVQFPVLQQNEDDTWYDTTGNIVFTCSKGLAGVGLDRKEWEEIRNMKPGETYEHTITKSELYQGRKVTYYAPFDKCDRVEDYKIAWKHFEQVFQEKIN